MHKTAYLKKEKARNHLRLQTFSVLWCRRPETFVPESFFVTYCFKETLAWFRALECTVLVLIPVLVSNEIWTGSLVLNDLAGCTVIGNRTGNHFLDGLNEKIESVILCFWPIVTFNRRGNLTIPALPDLFKMYSVYSLSLR